ncbi:hypothetical protein HPB50_015429 [Hyalomma asiaticum]|uniref:Uncharacterized protein n=1 Tax=Hyalomma asiaticum TaxID=266040 RepID=A0ACB7TL04_HYAAI|nr:hypothetical protein HPB50_015429 [Hyalomma asiaticum]
MGEEPLLESHPARLGRKEAPDWLRRKFRPAPGAHNNAPPTRVEPDRRQQPRPGPLAAAGTTHADDDAPDQRVVSTSHGTRADCGTRCARYKV